MSGCPKCGESYDSKIKTKSSLQRLPVFGRICLKVKVNRSRHSSRSNVHIYIHEE